MPKVKCNASKNWYHLLASQPAKTSVSPSPATKSEEKRMFSQATCFSYCRISFHQVLNAGISALSFHLVFYHESYSHERDFEWVLSEIIFFLLGRTIKVLLDFENTITDKAKPVIGYLITKKTQFLPQLSVICLNI